MDMYSATDTASEADDEALPAIWKDKGTIHGGYKTVSPRKAAWPTTMEIDPTPVETKNKYSQLAEENTYPATISLKPQGNYKQLIKEIYEKFPGTENRWFHDYINIKPPSEENIVQILALLNEKKAEYLLNEASSERPLKIVIKQLSEETDPQDIVDDLASRGYVINRISQMRNYKLKKLLPMFLLEIKKVGNYKNIFNERSICYFRTKIETFRRKGKPIICYNCSGFYHAARNCHLKPKCIKCGEHATRECSIKEKLPVPKCVNCGESGHIAAWKGCKAFPVIAKPASKRTFRSYADIAAGKREKTPGRTAEERPSTSQDIPDLKESLQAIKELKSILEEFPTLLEAMRLCKKAKTKQEKILIILNALVSD
ncbi:hypothetical protein AVEN_260098-1 [Araneus ventricosus]|uniref:CCHC-type domain-containing protein n=1 Tax=Araneus ventricosus TaxID=182803 RepID=A0A4Y2NKA4_ARAVE|nr:hypothetical protein AVEN_260098-1 [Araneus ventricosus]